MNKLIDFIKNVLANNAEIQSYTAGRIFEFSTAQGTHTYPMILWSIISDKTLADYIDAIGEAWKAEVQIDIFTKSVEASAALGNIVLNAFNSAELTEGILSSYTNEYMPSYTDEDETYRYIVRVYINHTL